MAWRVMKSAAPGWNARDMNAGEALKAAHAAGVQIEINGNNLVLKAAAPPPAAVHAALSQHKTEIIALLRSKGDRWQDYFDKQVRIAKLTVDCRGQRPKPKPSNAVSLSG